MRNVIVYYVTYPTPMKTDSYLFPLIDSQSLEVIYMNLTHEPQVKFDLSDGTKTLTLSLSRDQLKILSQFLGDLPLK